jgi:hypothetical protein
VTDPKVRKAMFDHLYELYCDLHRYNGELEEHMVTNDATKVATWHGALKMYRIALGLTYSRAMAPIVDQFRLEVRNTQHTMSLEV